MNEIQIMTEKILVRINGSERDGTYRRIGSTDYVHYREYAEEENARKAGEEPDQVLMKLSGSSLEIVRSGKIRSRMMFEEGKCIPAEYETPYGRIEMDVAGHRVHISREESRILVDMQYRLLRAGEEISQNTVSIEILPV